MRAHGIFLNNGKNPFILAGQICLLVSLRFNGAEINCRIAHVLGIQLMISR